MSDTKTANTNTPLAAPRPTRTENKPLTKVGSIGEMFENVEFRQRLAQSVPTHMNPDVMLRTFVQAVSNTPNIMKAGIRQAMGAFLTVSQLGLQPNNPLGHAYLIPFDKNRWDPKTRERVYERTDLQLIIGYKGFIDLGYRHPKVQSIYANCAWDKLEDFDFEMGTRSFLRHKPGSVSIPEGMKPTHAYFVAQLENGSPFEVLPWSEIMRIRNGSQGFQSALRIKEAQENDPKKASWKPPVAWTEAPWVKHEFAMARKTAVRAGSRFLPMSIEMAGAVALDEVQDRRRLDFSRVIDDDAADVLSGGLLNQPERDEEPEFDPNADPQREPAGDPGASFGMRGTSTSAETKPTTTKPAAKSTKTATPAASATATAASSAAKTETLVDVARAAQASRKPAAPAPEPDPEPEATFDAFMSDEYGEQVMIGDEPAYFDSPRLFADHLAQHAATSTNVRALIENNADAIEDARKADETADRVLAAVVKMADEPEDEDETPAPPVDDTPKPIPMATKNNKPDPLSYVGQCMDAIRTLRTADEIEAWRVLNKPVFGKLTPSNLRAIDKAIADQRDAVKPVTHDETDPPTESDDAQDDGPLGDEPPPPTSEREPDASASAPAKTDALVGVRDDLLQAIAAAKSAHDLSAIQSNAAMRSKLARLEAQSLDYTTQIREAFAARNEDFKRAKS